MRSDHATSTKLADESITPTMKAGVMLADELCSLPTVVDVETAARILGVGRNAVYSAIQSGQWPTRLLRLGRRIKIPTAELLALVGQPVQVKPPKESPATQTSKQAGMADVEPASLRDAFDRLRDAYEILLRLHADRSDRL